MLYLSRLSWVQDRVAPQGKNKPEGIFLKELIVQVISYATFFIFKTLGGLEKTSRSIYHTPNLQTLARYIGGIMEGEGRHR